MFFNIFYMFGGSGSLIITLAFSSPKTSQFLQGLVHLDRSASMLALYGVSISVGTYVSQLVYIYYRILLGGAQVLYIVA